MNDVFLQVLLHILRQQVQARQQGLPAPWTPQLVDQAQALENRRRQEGTLDPGFDEGYVEFLRDLASSRTETPVPAMQDFSRSRP